LAIAFILINTEIGCEDEVINALGGIEQVKEAYIVYGVYDIVAKVEAEDMETLKDIISSKVRKIPKVRSTMTMLVVEEKRFR